jgi:hypothetical protein
MNPIDRIFAGLKADIDIILDGLNGIVDLCSSETKRLESQETLWPVERDLILRMAKEIPGVRPPVIDEGLKAVLFEYAGFRHVFRHSYLTGIKWNRLKPLCKQLPGLHREIKTNLRDFFSTLEASIR